MSPQKRRRGFTLLELMTVIAIIAALLVAAVMACSSLITWAQQTSNKQTLTILNDALTRYKCEGGDLSVLSQANTIGGVIRKMASTITWCGMSHQVLQRGCTYPARSLSAIGSGAQYQFTRFNAYKSDYDTSTDIMGRLSAIGGGGATQAWVKNALTTAATKNYLVLSQPATSLVIGLKVQGTGTLCYDWGDGTSSTCSLSASYTTLSHTYSSAGAYGVTLIGNLTAFNSADNVGLTGSGTSGTCAFGGDISTMPSLTYLDVFGANMLGGSVTNLTGLTYIWVGGSNTLSGNITNLTGLTFFECRTKSALTGSITPLTQLTYFDTGYIDSSTVSGSISGLTQLTGIICNGQNTITGSIASLPSLNAIYINGSNTITGSVTGHAALVTIIAGGSNTLTGDISGLTSLQRVEEAGGANFTKPTDWSSFASLSEAGVKNMTQAQVDGLLAGMWANKDAAKPRSERFISCTSGCAAPSSTGYSYKALLQAYHTPNNNVSYSLWSVSTN